MRCCVPIAKRRGSGGNNIAPTQDVVAARNAFEGGRELVALHWGLVPHWAKEPKTGYSTINARAETVAERPALAHSSDWA